MIKIAFMFFIWCSQVLWFSLDAGLSCARGIFPGFAVRWLSVAQDKAARWPASSIRVQGLKRKFYGDLMGQSSPPIR